MNSSRSTFGASKFGGSKFGGGSSKSSKFNTGSGFGAAALKKIDNGGTRLHYGKNNRFAAIMDDDTPKNNPARLQLPVKTQGNRFAAINEEQSYPDLNNGNET